MNYILDISRAEHDIFTMDSRAIGRLIAAHPIVGAGVALGIKSGLGAAPWDVFHVSLARLGGISVGTATTATGLLALLIARVLGVRPGLGTLVNALVIGFCVD